MTRPAYTVERRSLRDEPRPLRMNADLVDKMERAFQVVRDERQDGAVDAAMALLASRVPADQHLAALRRLRARVDAILFKDRPTPTSPKTKRHAAAKRLFATEGQGT